MSVPREGYFWEVVCNPWFQMFIGLVLAAFIFNLITQYRSSLQPFVGFSLATLASGVIVCVAFNLLTISIIAPAAAYLWAISIVSAVLSLVFHRYTHVAWPIVLIAVATILCYLYNRLLMELVG